MKITKPEDKKLSQKEKDILIEKICSEFEKEFKTEEKGLDYYRLAIKGEYDRHSDICKSVEKLYTEAGWKKVSCNSNPSNGERAGLTGLQLYLYVT